MDRNAVMCRKMNMKKPPAVSAPRRVSLRDELLSELTRRNSEEPGTLYLPDAARRHFEGLPDPIRVFRGTSRARVLGVSWTTDRQLAEGFARGHRRIPVPEAVVATALVPKAAIFGVTVERNESEVILDPHRVADLEVLPAAFAASCPSL
jgi:hypothetical protein